ncbi:MAG: hypothetical protein U0359_13860 [Byssovorax sp.]
MRPLLLASLALSPLLAFACSNGGSTAGGTTTTTSSTSTTTTSGGEGGATGACASCDGACVDLANDVLHCGACGHACGGAHPFCDHGACGPAPCDVMGPICPNDLTCCGAACCPAWKRCCYVPGEDLPTCVDADAGACPTTCAACP